MVEESQLKYWRDAGHVARRALEAMKLELQPGKTFHESSSPQNASFIDTVENLPFLGPLP